jgi:hypothetical protein
VLSHSGRRICLNVEVTIQACDLQTMSLLSRKEMKKPVDCFDYWFRIWQPHGNHQKSYGSQLNPNLWDFLMFGKKLLATRWRWSFLHSPTKDITRKFRQ